MRLWVYAVRRVVLAVPVLIGAMTVLFVIFSALPAPTIPCTSHPSGTSPPCTRLIPCPQDPSKLCPNPVFTGDNALGLNQPVYLQWFYYLEHALTFHWGSVDQGSALGTGETGSGLPFLAGQSVSGLIGEFLPYSLELLALTLVFTLVIVVPLRNRALASPGGLADRAAGAWVTSGFSIPLFLVGMLAMVGTVFALGGPAAASPICGSQATAFFDLFGSWPIPPCSTLYGTTNIGPFGYPNWLGIGYISTPTGFPTLDALVHGDGWLALDTLSRMVLPALVLAFIAVAVILRYAGYRPCAPAGREHFDAVRGLGLPEEVERRRVGRSTLVELTGGLGPALVAVLGMLPVVEVLFSLWGIGRLLAYSVVGGAPDWDFGILFGVLLTCTWLIVGANLVIDVVRAYLDPRYRVKGGPSLFVAPAGSLGTSWPNDRAVNI
ncbi:MAG TPA: ABC transporter permease [Thermoplasmata archaeon]|nr:ABC transporter permease [Thermoplasmata archaeon]